MSASPSEVSALTRRLGRRCAAAGGSLVALLSLLQHAPLWLASLRGGVTLALLSLTARFGSAALARTIALDRRVAAAKETKS